MKSGLVKTLGQAWDKALIGNVGGSESLKFQYSLVSWWRNSNNQPMFATEITHHMDTWPTIPGEL